MSIPKMKTLTVTGGISMGTATATATEMVNPEMVKGEVTKIPIRSMATEEKVMWMETGKVAGFNYSINRWALLLPESKFYYHDLDNHKDGDYEGSYDGGSVYNFDGLGTGHHFSERDGNAFGDGINGDGLGAGYGAENDIW